MGHIEDRHRSEDILQTPLGRGALAIVAAGGAIAIAEVVNPQLVEAAREKRLKIGHLIYGRQNSRDNEKPKLYVARTEEELKDLLEEAFPGKNINLPQIDFKKFNIGFVSDAQRGTLAWNIKLAKVVEEKYKLVPYIDVTGPKGPAGDVPTKPWELVALPVLRKPLAAERVNIMLKNP